jgi:hypothetical protein
MYVCCECCVLSGRGLCDELITRPEESYRLWCVDMCDLEKITLVNEDERQDPLGRNRAKRERKKVTVSKRSIMNSSMKLQRKFGSSKRRDEMFDWGWD